MTTKQQAQAIIQKRFGGKQDRLDSWPAYLGNEDGTVAGSRYGYVYVRYPASNSAAVEVFNGGVPEVPGLRVMVGYRPERPDLIQALGISDVRQETASAVLYGILQNHSRQHYWNGSDPVYITFHQVTALGVYPSSGLTVTIYAGFIQRADEIIEIPEQTVDLTTSIPSNVGEGRYSLITLNPDGVVTVTNGAVVANYTTLTAANIPVTPVGHFRLAAVRMYYGQTAIVDNSSTTDIYDLRWPQESLSVSPVMYQTVTNADAGALSVGMPVYLSAAAAVQKAKADAAATSLVSGLMTGTVASASTGQMQLNGQITATTSQWDALTGGSGGLTVAAYSYLSAATAGHITTAAPTDPDQYPVKIGIALSTTVMLIDIDPSNNVIIGGYNTALDDVATIGDSGSNYTSIATAVASADLARLLLVTPGTYSGAVNHNRTDELDMTSLQQFGQLAVLSYTSGVALTLSSGKTTISNLKITGGSTGVATVSITSTEAAATMHLFKCDIVTTAAIAFENATGDYFWTWLDSCRIIGDATIRETAYLTDCIMYGNLTLSAGGTNAYNEAELGVPLIEIRGSKIVGSLTVGAGVTLTLKGLPQITGTITNSGTIVGAWLDADGVVRTSGRRRATVTKTDSYTATAYDEVIICNKATAMTITLPAATGSGRTYHIKNINTGTVTIDGDGSETIDGATTVDIATQYNCVAVHDYTSGAWATI